MNSPLRKLSIVIVVMFFALMGGATWVQFFQANSLNNDARNVRTLYRDYGHDRGPIVVDGTSVAYSVPVDDAFGFQRTYANGPLYAPVTGYYGMYSLSGIEQAANTVLNGTDDSLLLARIRALFTGAEQQGGTVELTIDPVVQQAAWDALGDNNGAIVALDPNTGAILAMVSKPTFDPNVLAGHTSAEVTAAYQALLADPSDPLFNRTIGGNLYPPGSTFKLIDVAMALESGEYTPDSQVPAPAEFLLPGTQDTYIRNPGGGPCTAEDTVTLTYALQVSCNTPFASLGVEFGADALTAQAEAFGFRRDLEVPLNVTPSTVGEDLDPAQTAMTAIGQFDTRVTPLQMAMVSAAVANGGVIMEPYLVAAERGPNLQLTYSASPREWATPMSATTAAQMTDMMVNVVENGTGHPAQISGVQVAGKTGTAETGLADDVAPDAWFTSFAPADAPEVAVAVVVEDGGQLGDEATGAQVAAPIARAVIQAVLAE
ncbi:penicillin-binding protein 2 [Occultella aeris]|uniref:Penicillin-binding protein A n=1 Tax=Occultella aeris TaxID=2761496 RepID=A0A7M4DD61_9MICO|nr:penicillin-binding transpeptidase domain-containing protein [Occultella aeris]VZO34780.1 Penicillin-binding protein A [Occultella aeris]